MEDKPVVQLVITLNKDGSVGINGPIGNKMLCYGLLEAGKDAVREFVDKNAASPDQKIVVPKFDINAMGGIPKG